MQTCMASSMHVHFKNDMVHDDGYLNSLIQGREVTAHNILVKDGEVKLMKKVLVLDIYFLECTLQQPLPYTATCVVLTLPDL